MKTVKILLGNSDRRINNLVEAAILDVCYNRAAPQFTRMGRASDFFRQGCYPGFDLIMVAPDLLLPETSHFDTAVPMEDVLKAVRVFKSRHSTPVVALAVSANEQLPLLEAGADGVVRFPFDAEKLRREVRRNLRLPKQVEPAPPSRWSVAASLLRGFKRLNTTNDS